MRIRNAPPAVRQPGARWEAAARPSSDDGGAAGLPQFIGFTSGSGLATVALDFPEGTEVGDVAVVYGLAGYGAWAPGAVPDPFFLTGSPAPYAGTPFPYARYLDPGADSWSSSWGLYPYDGPESVVREERLFRAGRTIVALDDAFSVSVGPDCPIAAFLMVFRDAELAHHEAGPSDNFLGWEDAGFGATPPYAFPKLDYAADSDLLTLVNFGGSIASRLVAFIPFMAGATLTRSSEDSSYPLDVLPPAAYTDLDIALDTDIDYGGAELLAQEWGVGLYMLTAVADQDVASKFFGSGVIHLTGTVPPDPTFTGSAYSYIEFDPIYWARMNEQFRFWARSSLIMSLPGVTGGSAAPRNTATHLTGSHRFQRFVQGV